MSNIQVEPEVYAFNERGIPENLVNSEPYQLLLKVKNGTATTEDKDNIFHQIYHSCYGSKKKIALAGCYIDFSKWLKRYWVQYNYGQIVEMYAFNKMNIRKNRYTNTGIVKIVEVI